MHESGSTLFVLVAFKRCVVLGRFWSFAFYETVVTFFRRQESFFECFLEVEERGRWEEVFDGRALLGCSGGFFVGRLFGVL